VAHSSRVVFDYLKYGGIMMLKTVVVMKQNEGVIVAGALSVQVTLTSSPLAMASVVVAEGAVKQ
jgi:hypothetical protein